MWIFASYQFVYAVSPAMKAIFCLPLAAVVLTVLGLAGELRGWRRAAGGRLTRLVPVVVLLTPVLFPVFLGRWNLLGFHF